MDIDKKIDLIGAVLGNDFSEEDKEIIKNTIKIGGGNLAKGICNMVYISNRGGWNRCELKNKAPMTMTETKIVLSKNYH